MVAAEAAERGCNLLINPELGALAAEGGATLAILEQREEREAPVLLVRHKHLTVFQSHQEFQPQLL